jgi:glutathione S-transferase
MFDDNTHVYVSFHLNIFFKEVTKLFRESDETKKAEMKKNLQDNVIPKAWGKFDEILKQNGTGVLVGKNVSYADIYIAFMTEWLSAFLEFTKTSDYPDLLAHQKKILSLPGIKEWIEKRPVTEF